MRRLKRSWVEEYVARFAGITESPPQYHAWTAVTLIGASLKRRVWFDRVAFKLYPNLYTVLVGRPGIGKGIALSIGMRVASRAKTVNILSDRLTMEYVLQKMSQGFGATKVGTTLVNDTSAFICSTELSVFITSSQFSVTALTDLWESRDGVYGYGTRGRGEYNIESPCVTLLGATAQEWLVRSIPKDAVGGGFTRRVNFVYAKSSGARVAFPKNTLTTDDLVEDLREIATLHGEFKLSKEAEVLFEQYYIESVPDEFDDQAVAGYKTSRWVNALKVAMALSAAESDRLLIEKRHWLAAVKMTEQVLADLDIVFRAVGESDLTEVGDKMLRFIESRGYARRGEIMRHLWKDITIDDLDKLLITFREANLIREVRVGNNLAFEVVPKP